jgi:hypothetical protein
MTALKKLDDETSSARFCPILSVDLMAVYGSMPVALVWVIKSLTVDENFQGRNREMSMAKTSPPKVQNARSFQLRR